MAQIPATSWVFKNGAILLKKEDEFQYIQFSAESVKQKTAFQLRKIDFKIDKEVCQFGEVYPCEHPSRVILEVIEGVEVDNPQEDRLALSWNLDSNQEFSNFETDSSFTFINGRSSPSGYLLD